MKTMIPSMVEMSQILIEKWNKNAETKRTFDVHTDITEVIFLEISNLIIEHSLLSMSLDY